MSGKVDTTEERTVFTAETEQEFVDLFYKESYPSMYLISEGNRTYIRGYYTKDEQTFITAYLLKYGTGLKSIEPEELKALLIRDTTLRLEHFHGL